jgi:hypothetical protein
MEDFHSTAYIAFLLLVVFFCIITGTRKLYNPRDFQNIDIEAASQDVPRRTSSLDNSNSKGHRRRRRHENRHSTSPASSGEPEFWLTCPCKHCERHSKPKTRMYSTVVMHIRHHLLGEKFKVIFGTFHNLSPSRTLRSGYYHVYHILLFFSKLPSYLIGLLVRL